MKKLTNLLNIMIISTTFWNGANAQNLVPNPSFEDTVACPSFGSQIAWATGWNSFRNTPDYYNACAPYNNGVSVPANILGYQLARTGHAYAGFTPHTSGDYREWIGAQLIQPLTIGKKYLVSFFVNLSYKPSTKNGIGTNKIGARLSTMSYPSNNVLPLNGYAQIYTDSIITDTLNWVNISGSFIADSAYSYFVVGNFSPDSLTSTILLDSNALSAYYYLDDVSLTEDTGEGINYDYSNNALKIFPNPAQDRIEILGNEIQSLILFDVLGRITYSTKVEFISQLKINTSSLPRGVYYLHVKGKNINTIQKIILQ